MPRPRFTLTSLLQRVQARGIRLLSITLLLLTLGILGFSVKLVLEPINQSPADVGQRTGDISAPQIEELLEQVRIRRTATLPPPNVNVTAPVDNQSNSR